MKKIGDIEINVNNQKKFKLKSSQNTILRNLVHKWKKLPRVIREKSKKNLKENFTRKDAKKTRRIPMARKLKALKLYFFIVHKNQNLNLSFYLVIQRKDVNCLIYNITTCNF